jgi:hypothetical protein
MSWLALRDQYNLDGSFLTSRGCHILQHTGRFVVRGAQACSQLTFCRNDTRERYSFTTNILIFASGDQNKLIDHIRFTKDANFLLFARFKTLQPSKQLFSEYCLTLEDILDTHARGLASSVDKRDARHPSGHAKE